MSESGESLRMLDGSEASGGSHDTETVAIGEFEPELEGAQIGQQVGRYVVLQEVGRGAMGRVLRAYDPKLQREVALKELQVQSSDTASYRSSLVAEARAMAKLSHPNVVSVFDVEEVQQQDRTRLILVMEYVEGVTLREWLGEHERSWADIVDRFVRAGRGLAAAHAAGLLHRDFKPANVMEGHGEVKVTDFGLAKAGALPTGRSDTLENTETHTSIMGTPRYMAPEQHMGRRDLGPAIDQYAFCVALWEALTGEPPFGNKSIVKAKLDGPPAWPRTDVPSWLSSALERGLQPEPGRRFESMEALLAALDVGPSRGPSRWTLVGGGLLIAGVVAMVATTDSAPPPCGGAAGKLDGVWDDATKQRVEAAIRQTEAAWADSAWSLTSSRLDGYATDWVAMHTEACEATSVRKEQSAAVMDLRMACLHRARTDLAAVTDVLQSADIEVVERIASIVDVLPALESCADIEALQAGVEPPPPREADRVAEIQELLAHARAERKAGRYEAARKLVSDAETLAEGLTYGPVHTDVEYAMGKVLDALGEFEKATQRLQRAMSLAAENRQLLELEYAASSLMMLLGYRLSRPEEALRYKELVEGFAKGHPQREASLHSMLGSIAHRQGRYSESVAEFRRALELESTVHDDVHPRLADFHGNIALALSGQGKFAEAEAELRIARDMFEATLGPDHPDMATVRNNLAGALLNQGRKDEAIVEFRASLELRRRLLGADHRRVAQSQGNLATALRSAGHYDEAETLQRESLATLKRKFGPDDPDVTVGLSGLGAILTKKGEHAQAAEAFTEVLERELQRYGPEHPGVASARTNLGTALRVMGDLEGAQSQHEQALQVFEASLGPEHPLVATVLVEQAQLASAAGQRDSAQTLLSRAVSIREAALGNEHPETISARESLSTLQETGRLAP